MAAVGFDFDGARKAGVTDHQIVEYLRSKRDLSFDIGGALDAGVTPTQIVDYLTTAPGPLYKEAGLAARVLEKAGQFVSGAWQQTKADVTPTRSVMEGYTPPAPSEASPVAPMRRQYYERLREAERAAPERAAERAKVEDVTGRALRDIRAKKEALLVPGASEGLPLTTLQKHELGIPARQPEPDPRFEAANRAAREMVERQRLGAEPDELAQREQTDRARARANDDIARALARNVEALADAPRQYRNYESGLVGSTGATLAYTGDKLGLRGMRDIGESMSNWAEGKRPKKPTFADNLINAVGSMASFYVPGLGVMKGTQALAVLSPTMARWSGAGVMAGLEAAAEAHETYEANRKRGLSHEEAGAAADKTFTANLGLLAVTNKIGLFNDIRSMGRKVSAGAIVEGPLQEGPQQVIQNYFTGRPLGEGVAEASAIGAIVGGGAGAVHAIATGGTDTRDPAGVGPAGKTAPQELAGAPPATASQNATTAPTGGSAAAPAYPPSGPALAQGTPAAPAESASRTDQLADTVGTSEGDPRAHSLDSPTVKADAFDEVTIGGKRLPSLSDALLAVAARSANAETARAAQFELTRRVETKSGQAAGSIAAAATARPGGVGGMSDGMLRLVSRSPDAARAKAAQIEMARRQHEAAEAGTDTARAEPIPGDARSTSSEESPVEIERADLPGAQYTGFISDATNTPTAGTVPGRVITREEVLEPFLKALGIPVYEGRLKSGSKLGYFRPRKEVVRIKNASDLETTAHEIAHALDDRVFNGFGTQKGVERTRPWVTGPDHRTYSAELRGLSYDHTKSYEGFAEFVRLWMTQPEKAASAAPKFNEWFNKFVGEHRYGPVLLRAREGMLSWFGQDALARARSKIGDKADINQFLSGFWDRFRQSVSDDLHGVYRMERELSGEIKPQGAYETARLTRASHSMMEGLLRQGRLFRKPDGSFDYVGKGLEQILEPVSDRLEDFMMYAVGRSANELMAQGREHLFTKGEISAMLALETPEFKRAFFDYQFWNRGVLDFAEQAGVLNAQTRALWKRAEYLPFYRVGQAGSERSMGGVEGNWKGIQKLTGGSENLRDVLGNIVQNASMLIDVSLKNEARAKIVALANSTHGGGHFLEHIRAESRKVKIDRDQVRDKLMEAAGTDGKLGPGDQAQLSHFIDELFEGTPYLWDFLLKNQAPTGGSVFAVLREGKPSYYEVVDPILFRAISALNRPAQSEVVKLLGIAKRIGQASITLTPDFAIANIARDTIMGAIMSRGGFRPVIDSIRGMAGRIAKDPAYREYIANGGGFASYYVDENAFRAHLERFYHHRGIDPKTVIDAPAKFLYFAENVADAFEISTRLGEYKRLRERGEHPRHAAYLAREVSTDFAMRGDSATLGFLYDTVIFLRPAVVSMDRLYRGLAHDPNRGLIAAKSAALMLLSGALYLLNRDNEKYKDLEDWDRDSYWHFFVPKPEGGELHFRYPKIWEVGMMATLAERTLERTLDTEPKEYAKDLARVIGQQFGLNFMPQAVAPLFEQAMNRLSFTKRPIESQNLRQLQPFMRAHPSTSETMRALGMATRGLPPELQISPARAESLLRGYLNTWALYGLMLSDAALFGDKAPERRLDQYPVLRRFLREEPPIHTRHEAKFYELLQEAEQLRASHRKLLRLGEREAAATVAENPVMSQAATLEAAQRLLAAKRKQVETIRNSDLPPDEKRRQLDRVTAERNALFKRVAVGAAEAIKRREANAKLEAEPAE